MITQPCGLPNFPRAWAGHCVPEKWSHLNLGGGKVSEHYSKWRFPPGSPGGIVCARRRASPCSQRLPALPKRPPPRSTPPRSKSRKGRRSLAPPAFRWSPKTSTGNGPRLRPRRAADRHRGGSQRRRGRRRRPDGAPDPAHGRTAGSGARPDRGRALRLRQGQPVLPARHQSRPRHRLRRLYRRRAEELPHPRARAGLSRHQRPAFPRRSSRSTIARAPIAPISATSRWRARRSSRRPMDTTGRSRRPKSARSAGTAR